MVTARTTSGALQVSSCRRNGRHSVYCITVSSTTDEMVSSVAGTLPCENGVFLDFSKAYDRLHRPWVLQCMASMGFGPQACQWVRLMLHSTQASAMYNGWQSPAFPTPPGVQQGSPLSPLLYVLGAQPLASHLRQQVSQDIFRPIALPYGQSAPVSHQHADDTSLHVLQPSDAQIALNTSVSLVCSATSSQLNVGKSKGFLVQSQPLVSPTVSTLPGISFIVGSEHIKHLGVLLGYQMSLACQLNFSKILHSFRAKISHWSTRGLSFLGRVHVAKQAIAASLWYHATFQSPSAALIKQLASVLSRFVASARLQLPVDDAASLAQGSAANPAELPELAPGGSLHPGRAASMLPYQAGGVGLVDVQTQIQALQAKVVSRLLEPERLAWKVFQSHWLYPPSCGATAPNTG